MSNRDIMPHTSPQGGHNRILGGFRMGALTTSATASTSWEEGEPLILTAASGDLDVAADAGDTVTADTLFLAAASSAGLLQLFNGTSGAATHNITVPVYPFSEDVEYVFRFAYNNSDTLVDINTIFQGDIGGVWRDDDGGGTGSLGGVNGDFGFDQNGTGLVVTRILDADGRDFHESGGTGIRLVAKRVSTA